MLVVSSNWCRCHEVKLLWLQYKWSGSLPASDQNAAAIVLTFISKTCKIEDFTTGQASFHASALYHKENFLLLNGRWFFIIKKPGHFKTFHVTPICLTFRGASLCAHFLPVVNRLHSSFICLLSAGRWVYPSFLNASRLRCHFVNLQCALVLVSPVQL